MIVHIMQPAIREYYRLEEIWGEKEVKFGAAKRISKRTAEDGEDAKPVRKTSRHLAASQAIDDEDAPKKPARKTASKTATRTGAKSASPKTPVGKTVKVAASKSATAAKKSPAKRASAKKVAA